MLTVNDYIKLILKKKKWTNTKLCHEINKIEVQLGDKKTTPQNITNYLNGYWTFGPKLLVKYEKALGLVEGTLIKMVPKPSTKAGKQELKDLIEKVREVK